MTKQRILFVDDDHHFREGLRLTLRSYQKEWDIAFAESVDDALTQARRIVPDVIVSDINMPRRSGLDLLVELKNDPVLRKLPVIILTGNAELDLKRKALDLGATDLLNKPFHREDLFARLRNALRLKSYEDQLRDHNQKLEDAVQERTRELERSKRGILWRLAKAGEFRDEETGHHVARVACASQLVANAMGIDEVLTEAIFLTSPLHDIGKIGVSDSILLKPGPLTDEEMEIMRTHCMIGAAILLETPSGFGDFGEAFLGTDHDKGIEADVLLQTASEICLTHHERWDGEGYPHHLAGDAIPIAGRIVAISDVYDALRSERPYKKAFSVDKALNIIQETRGTHFDPDVCDAFTSIQGDIEEMRLKLAEPVPAASDQLGSSA
jgi:response regulator RpfG family c-di-GMP phosphodiesterase